jgi:hypothetical protein
LNLIYILYKTYYVSLLFSLALNNWLFL